MDFGVSRFRRLLPVACASFVSSDLLDLSDTLIAGNLLGEKALAALNLFWPCVELMFFAATSVAGGSAILYAAAAGKFERERASRVFSGGLFFAVVLGALLMPAMYFLRDGVIGFFGAGPEVSALLADYWNVFALEMLIFPASLYLRTLVCADGDGTICTISFTVELIVNVVASWSLCPVMGIRGCAVGTLISTFTATLVAAAHFFRKSNSLRFHFAFSLFDGVKAFALDFPEASTSLFAAGVYTVMNKLLVSRFGDGALTVMSVVLAANGLCLVFQGVGSAAQPVVGMYYAEGDLPAVRRVMRAAVKASLALGITLSAAVFLFPQLVTGAIGVDSPDTAAAAVQALRIVAPSYVFTALVSLFTSYCLFVERPMLSSLLVVSATAVLPLAGCVVGSSFAGEMGFWGGFALGAPVALALFFLGAVLKSGWRTLPWFLPHDRDGNIFSRTLRIVPEDVCAVSEAVQERMVAAGAGMKAAMRAALLVEDTLMAVKDRNGERKVLAEVTLDVSAPAMPGYDCAGRPRLILRDDGRIIDIVDAKDQDTPASLREHVLGSVMQRLSVRDNLVTVGYNRSVLVL